MGLQNSLTWFAIALALLAIGLPYMSYNHIFQLLRGRKPHTDEDNLMARRFMIMIGAIGFAGVIFFMTLVIINFTEPMAIWVSKILTLTTSTTQMDWLRVLCGVIIFGAIGGFLCWLWRRTKESVEINPNDTSDIGALTTSVNNLSDKIDKLVKQRGKPADKPNNHSAKNMGK